MPTKIVIQIPAPQQARLLRELRRARRGHWLAIHILLLLTRHYSPSEIASVLLCARSTVYAVAWDWQQGRRWPETTPTRGPLGLTASLGRSLAGLLKKTPGVYGWCRTRWSCATLAMQLEAQRGIWVTAETVRCWLHALGWVWKRAKLVAKDNDPDRVSKLARIRCVYKQLGQREALLFADELDLPLLAKVGYQWMPKATQVKVMTPGQNQRRYLAGALDITTGQVHHCFWFRKLTGLFLDLLDRLDRAYPVRRFDRIYVVADNCQIHKAATVQHWLQQHPRFELLFLPTYCPRANPIERCFGDLHDKVTRNHRRKRIRDLMADVERHLVENGPWRYPLSQIYDAPEVTTAIRKLKNPFTPVAA